MCGLAAKAHLWNHPVLTLLTRCCFPGHSLTQFVRHCADHFLNSEHKEIRMEAARTCSRLLTPSIHLISGHGHVVSQTAVQVVADVLSKLLVVGITDPGGKDRFILAVGYAADHSSACSTVGQIRCIA